jgi:hypothetical protein
MSTVEGSARLKAVRLLGGRLKSRVEGSSVEGSNVEGSGKLRTVRLLAQQAIHFRLQ